MKNILITGGCGFIGRNLCKSLLNDSNVNLRIIDNFSVPGYELFEDYIEKNRKNLKWNNGLSVFKGDIRNVSEMRNFFEGATHVVHLAANTGVQPSIDAPEFDCEINVIGTQNCLHLSAENNVKKFVFASSGAPLEIKYPRCMKKW